MQQSAPSTPWQQWLRLPAVAAALQTLTIAVVACSGIAVLGALVTRLMLDELRGSLGQMATGAAAMIDADTHARFVRDNHAEPAEYQAATKPLRVLRETNPDITFAFTGIIRGREMYYVLDADPKDSRGQLLELDPQPPLPDEQLAWDRESMVVESEPSRTQWGIGLRAYAPIRDRYGGRIAYVGLTLSAERFSSAISALRWAMFAGMGVSLLLAALGGLAVLRLQRERNRALEAALTASRSKSQFLANMSHEMRTPLNGVIGAFDLLKRTEMTPAQRNLTTTAHQSARALLVLIDDVLEWSKIEAGKFELNKSRFDLHELIEQSMAVVAPRALARGLDLTQYIDSETRRWLYGDTARLRQVLLNLLSNAIKFTERGSVHLRVSQQTQGADAVLLRFEIRDTGIGIAPEVLTKLFRPFTQGDASNTRRYGGSGLGLAIAREMAHLMDGDLGCQSEPGRGSTFWFTATLQLAALPLETAGTRPTVAPVMLAVGPATQTRTRHTEARVLLAEDNPINSEVMQAMLRTLGLDHRVAVDGAEALAIIEEGWDLVLMDCQMPVVDGYAATREIRARDIVSRRGARLPIVAVTANAYAEDRQRCLDAGMDDFLSKPATLEQLQKMLARWIDFGDKAEESPAQIA